MILNRRWIADLVDWFFVTEEHCFIRRDPCQDGVLLRRDSRMTKSEIDEIFWNIKNHDL